MTIVTVTSGKFIEASELAEMEDLSALAIAKKMLLADPENEVLRKTVEILSGESPGDVFLCEEAAVAEITAALAANPDDSILRDALLIAQDGGGK